MKTLRRALNGLLITLALPIAADVESDATSSDASTQQADGRLLEADAETESRRICNIVSKMVVS